MPRVTSDDVKVAIEAIEKFRRGRSIENAVVASEALAKVPGTWVVVDGVRYVVMSRGEDGFVLHEEEEEPEEIPF